ncbi:hypothetical protein E2I00_018587, partial [Balaenoptera physalus]
VKFGSPAFLSITGDSVNVDTMTNRWLSAEGSPRTAAPLASVGGARLAPSGCSLISPLQDPAALGNARGGANVGARPAGTRRRGRRRRGLWSERGEFGCQRRVDAGTPPTAVPAPEGLTARSRVPKCVGTWEGPWEQRSLALPGRFVPLRAEGGRVAGSRSCYTHPPGLTRTRLPSRARQVFRVEVLCHGRRHTIKKLSKVPDFPSKRLPNWRTRGLEQRRQSLEAYIQGILYLNQDVPKELLEFLSLRHLPIVPKAGSWGQLTASLFFSAPWGSSCQATAGKSKSLSALGLCCPLVAICQGLKSLACPRGPGEEVPLTHNPHLGPRYQCGKPLPNVVVNGVLQGLYGFSASTAKAQPEAACHPAPVPPMP